MTRFLLSKIVAIVLLFMALPAAAQLNVTTQTTPLTLARKILGTGVTITNAQFHGPALSAATFTAVHGSFPLDSGIVLTSGRAKTASGAPGVDGPGSSFASYSSNAVGDADLDNYSGKTTHDACILEFDFVPQGDSINVRYLFGSEEYPEYNCTNFNDVFAFFISGPGFLQKKNIALVPNAPNNTPVSINSINNGIPGSAGGNISECWALGPGSPFTQFYVDNQTGTVMAYDGHTVVLTAKAKVTPCQTYHIKLAIADAGDWVFDSGVFIEAGSFSSKRDFNASVTGPNIDGGNVTMIEACKTAEIKLTRAAEVIGPFNIVVSYSGTATPGTDFTTIPSPIVFSATDTVKTFTISAIADALNEGTEKAVFRFSKNTCTTQFADSAVIYIKDSLVNRAKFDTSFCTATPIIISSRDTVANVTNSYLWSNGSTTQSISVTQPGSYIATHTYSQRCFNIDTFNIISNDPSLTFANTSPQICAGDSVTLSVTSNADSLTWNTGAHTSSIVVSSGGQYWVKGINNKGCSKTDTVNVTVTPLPVFNLGADTSICANKTIQLDASSPGATYAWNTGATSSSITVSTAGLYSVTATANGCSAKDSITIGVKPVPVVNLGSDTSICQNKTVQLNAAYTGASYVWNTGATTSSITVNSTGEYSVVNTLNGCTATDTINVVVAPVPIANLGADTSICTNKTILLDAFYPGATYAWNTGATSSSITVSGAGNYSVVSTLGNCSATDTISIALKPLPLVNLGADTSICQNKTIQLNATYTGASYTWNTGATTPSITVANAGQYSVVNTLNGCIAKDTINITVTPAPVVYLGADTSVCQGNTVPLNALYPGASYSWSTGATSASITVNTTGMYSVVNTLNGCTAMDTINVMVTPLPFVNLGGDTAICQNKTIQLNAAYAGATHAWNTGATTPSITVASAGQYSVVNTLNGCIAKDTINITVTPAPVVYLGADTSVCQGNTVPLNALYPGASYSWSTGATSASITVNTTGTYSVVNTLNGCKAMDTINVMVTPLPFVNLGGDTAICQNKTIQLNAAYTGASHAWNTGATSSSITVANAGQYSVVNTLNGCVAKDTINITVTPAPVVDLGADRTICTYDTIQLTASSYPGASYTWNTGVTGPSILVRNAGSYSVISTLNGCSATDTVKVLYKIMPVANAGYDAIIPENTTIQLNATQHPNNAGYLWSPAGSLSNPLIPNPVASPTAVLTEYTLRVTSVDGCIAEDKVIVRVTFPITIPNAFSPNGDHINDTWRITNIELYPTSKVSVYNRYGQQVFNAAGWAQAWDGTSKGKPLAPATYYYIIDTGDGHTFTGWVVLLR